MTLIFLILSKWFVPLGTGFRAVVGSAHACVLLHLIPLWTPVFSFLQEISVFHHNIVHWTMIWLTFWGLILLDYKIQTHKSFKITLFIRTKCNVRFGVFNGINKWLMLRCVFFPDVIYNSMRLALHLKPIISDSCAPNLVVRIMDVLNKMSWVGTRSADSFMFKEAELYFIVIWGWFYCPVKGSLQ